MKIQINIENETYREKLKNSLEENNFNKKLLNIHIEKTSFFASDDSMDWLAGDWVAIIHSKEYLLKERGKRFYTTRISSYTLTQEMKDNWPLKTETGQLILPLFDFINKRHENFFKAFNEPLRNFVRRYDSFDSWSLVINKNIFYRGIYIPDNYKNLEEKIIKKIKY